MTSGIFGRRFKAGRGYNLGATQDMKIKSDIYVAIPRLRRLAHTSAVAGSPPVARPPARASRALFPLGLSVADATRTQVPGAPPLRR